tara:strand:- start:1865 stop:2365 length:501 start_codon:yes stop_codon:yes gene_type:complete
MNLIKKFSEKKNLFFKKENIFSLTSILLIFLLDRFSKIKIIDNFNENSFFINNFINLDLVWNTGIGFGLLSFETNLIYNIITFVICVIILILFYASITSEKSEKLIFSIIIGGAIGNLYDRLFYKAVPDFIDLHYNSFHWFTFNVADIFITIGIIVFLIKGFFIRK